jgi:hypothetical protein
MRTTALALMALLAVAGCSKDDENGETDAPSYPEALGSAHEHSKRKAAEVNLRQLGNALKMYAVSHGRYPDTLADLVQSQAVPGEMIESPVTGKPYVFVTGLEPDAPAGSVILYESQPAYEGEHLVLRTGGGVELLTPAELKSALASDRAARD